MRAAQYAAVAAGCKGTANQAAGIRLSRWCGTPAASRRGYPNWRLSGIVASIRDGAVAQLGERFVRNEEVEGSTPFSSTGQGLARAGPFFCARS